MAVKTEITVDMLWLIDLDRTTLDSNKVLTAFTNLGIASGLIDEASIDAARQKTEESGGSFDDLQYLRDQGMSEADLTGMIDPFVSKPNTDFLYDDALPFLDRINDQSGHIAMLLTYGSVDWQTAKLLASGLGSQLYIVTNETHKGHLISEWKMEDGRYKTVTASGVIVIANSITLVDDKANSFLDLPDDCNGWLVRRPGIKVLPSQAGPVPPNTKSVGSLKSIHVN